MPGKKYKCKKIWHEIDRGRSKSLKMKKWIFIPAFIIVAYSANSQANDSITITGTEYVPIEGRREGPTKLEGSWVLSKGLTARPSNLQKKFEEKKQAPGTEISRDSVTRTRTVNGVQSTTTEYQIRQVAAPIASEFTPPQGDEVHEPESPSISFFGLNETVTGFTGCNKYSGRFTLRGNKISFNHVNASTKIPCLGKYDEKEFVSKLKKVNAFKNDGGKLQLLHGDEVLLVFNKK